MGTKSDDVATPKARAAKPASREARSERGRRYPAPSRAQHLTPEDRAARGKAARAEVPQRGWTVLAVKIQNEMGKCFAVRQTGRNLAGVLVTINQEDGRIYLDDGTELHILESVKPELAGLTEAWCRNPTKTNRQ